MVETLSFVTGAYCVDHQEVFMAGDAQSGSYALLLDLSDPDGFTMLAGGPTSTFVAPAAREHGTPPVAAVAE